MVLSAAGLSAAGWGALLAIASRPVEFGSTPWFVVMLLAGAAVGVAIAMAQKLRR